jgi:glyoxylase-like metal-dependent hydrolase (beta-lactamase superfamily II)
MSVASGGSGVSVASGGSGVSVASGFSRKIIILSTLAFFPAASAGAQDVQVLPVRNGIYMISGPGANTTVQVGHEGVLVVDPADAAVGKTVLAEIRKLSDKPVRFVINTNADADHVGGNQTVAGSGETLQGGNTRAATVFSSGGAPIWAHEQVLNRLTGAGGESAGWPTDTYFVAQKDLFVNGEPVQLFHVPAAHSDGDSLVMFRRSDVIAAGDIFTPDRYPVIDVQRGGINGLIDGLNHLLRLTVPEFNQQGGTLVIPGHGRLSDEADVSEYRDMVTIVRDRIRDMVKKKMTLEQVKAARPTLDYDGIYGADKAAVFVEQVYRSVSK